MSHFVRHDNKFRKISSLIKLHPKSEKSF
jgi:hypothetical protein